MKKLEYYDPYEAEKEGGYTFDAPQKMEITTNDEAAEKLWNKVMRRMRDESGNVVLKAPDTASQVLARKIMSFMNDEDHIYNKFDGEQPKMSTIYRAAGFSSSKWGRIISGELSDIERGNAFAIAIALRLNEEQTAELLYSAGFAINYELDLDAAMMYFIRREIYDLKRILKILSNFSNVKNGLDCFVFQPITEAQKPRKS